MNTTTTQYENEVALIQANTQPVAGKTVHWLLSRKQVMYILRDLAISQQATQGALYPKANYQEEALPVVSFESYFGLSPENATAQQHYVVVRTPMADGSLGKLIVSTIHPVRIRKLGFAAHATTETGLVNNSQDILGAFDLSASDKVVLPDISAILATIV